MKICDKCHKEFKWLEKKFEVKINSNGQIFDAYYCTSCYDYFINPKNKNLIDNHIKTIKEKVSNIFENIEEKNYAKKIVTDTFEGYGMIKENLVGYKSKVVKKLRELDIVTKDRNFIFLKDAHGFQYEFNQKPFIVLRMVDKNIDKGIKKLQNLKSEVGGKKFICSECEYKWQSRKKFGDPAICPRCKSSDIISFNNLKEMLSKKK